MGTRRFPEFFCWFPLAYFSPFLDASPSSSLVTFCPCFEFELVYWIVRRSSSLACDLQTRITRRRWSLEHVIWDFPLFAVPWSWALSNFGHREKRYLNWYMGWDNRWKSIYHCLSGWPRTWIQPRQSILSRKEPECPRDPRTPTKICSTNIQSNQMICLQLYIIE